MTSIWGIKRSLGRSWYISYIYIVRKGPSRVQCLNLYIVYMEIHTRWAPFTSYKWSIIPYEWPYKLVTGLITSIRRVRTLLRTGRGPPCIESI